MTDNTWAYCPDRQGVCGLLIANAEQMERDAARIAALGADIETLRMHVASESKRIAELGWSRIEELSADLRRARAEICDLERENASLRRRLREGGR